MTAQKLLIIVVALGAAVMGVLTWSQERSAEMRPVGPVVADDQLAAISEGDVGRGQRVWRRVERDGFSAVREADGRAVWRIQPEQGGGNAQIIEIQDIEKRIEVFDVAIQQCRPVPSCHINRLSPALQDVSVSYLKNRKTT